MDNYIYLEFANLECVLLQAGAGAGAAAVLIQVCSVLIDS